MESRYRFAALLLANGLCCGRGAVCPGTLDVAGHGSVSLIPTGWAENSASAGSATVEVAKGNEVTVNMGARAYFADTCTAGSYHNEQYTALNLLGKTLRYTVDMSGAGCGCNAALYLVSMRQNTQASECEDFYCDANHVCGVSCAEIDIQEGNQFSWHSTLHASNDAGGIGAGYGGGDNWNGPRDFTSEEYGPGGRCVDTSKAFEVAASFHSSDSQSGASLTAMEVVLSQDGHSCPLTARVDSYTQMEELSAAMRAGMTLVLSYWSADSMLWMDGKGLDGQGPCAFDSAATCPGSVKFHNFSLRDIHKPEGQRASQGEPMPKPTQKDSGSVVEQYGKLRTRGNQIVGEAGYPVRLRGMSMFWSQWMPKYWHADVVRWLREDWHVTIVRAAMGVEAGGYLEDPGRERARLEEVVQGAIAAGIYVIIDWHDSNAHLHVNEAKQFFEEMAQKYGDIPNVLFETFNEPEQIDWATAIKPYHEEVVPVIRRHSDNLIILGTRTWSQEVDTAAQNPVAGANLAYTLHFYAASMGEDLRNRALTAWNMGVPLFVTEWGTCEYNGNGRLDLREADAWLRFLEEHNISDTNWAVSDKAESCAALQPGASGSGGWPVNALTASGTFVRASLRAQAPFLDSASTARGAHDGNVKDDVAQAADVCPGTLEMAGHGQVSIIPAGWGSMKGATAVNVRGGNLLEVDVGSRAYFADTCTAGFYDHTQYLALNLLGKTLRYTLNISGLGQSCHAALSLVSMRQNGKPSRCHDYYCDAASTCGVSCNEINLQDANSFSWQSALRRKSEGDAAEQATGTNLHYDGRDGHCVDTSEPFLVTASFPVDAEGTLKGIEVLLSQKDRSCPVERITSNVGTWSVLSNVLKAGMTPAISYWSSVLDSSAAKCSRLVSYSNFSVTHIDLDANLDREPHVCPGTFEMHGFGTVWPVGAQFGQTAGQTARNIDVLQNDTLLLHRRGGAYFASACKAGNNGIDGDFLSLNLLGKTLRYTTDVNGAGCGCRAALYLVSTHSKHHTKIDIQEASRSAWHSKLYATKSAFTSLGFTANAYGLGAESIDATKPFHVDVSFPIDGTGALVAVKVSLSQSDKRIELTLRISDDNSMKKIADALQTGMTPVVEYRMDNTEGQCDSQETTRCIDPLRFYGFAVAPIDRDDGASVARSTSLEFSCESAFTLEGYGKVVPIPAGWPSQNAALGPRSDGGPKVKVWDGNEITMRLGGRAYFADQCTAGVYNQSQYLGLNLLGKRLSYMTDLSGTGCGCNSAVYLVPMRQNSAYAARSVCHDYYCDASGGCGVECAEVDIQEASQYAWHSSLHSAGDAYGVRGGYGGGGKWAAIQDFTGEQYAPGGSCVDTSQPFEVSAYFPADQEGRLKGVAVRLSQHGRSCPLTLRLAEYGGLVQLSEVMAAGMTPVITYWSDGNVRWQSGKEADRGGPCNHQTVPEDCANSVKFYGFTMADLAYDEDFFTSSTTTSSTSTTSFTSSTTTSSTTTRGAWMMDDDAQASAGFSTDSTLLLRGIADRLVRTETSSTTFAFADAPVAGIRWLTAPTAPTAPVPAPAPPPGQLLRASARLVTGGSGGAMFVLAAVLLVVLGSAVAGSVVVRTRWRQGEWPSLLTALAHARPRGSSLQALAATSSPKDGPDDSPWKVPDCEEFPTMPRASVQVRPGSDPDGIADPTGRGMPNRATGPKPGNAVRKGYVAAMFQSPPGLAPRTELLNRGPVMHRSQRGMQARSREEGRHHAAPSNPLMMALTRHLGI